MWCSVYSCLLITVWAGQSLLYRLWNYISHWDYKDIGQKWQAPVHAEPQGWREKKKKSSGKLLSFPYSPLWTMFKSNTYFHQTAVDSPYCAKNHGSERINENKQKGRGKIKIQKYIFICLYLYIFIYLRGMYPQKKKTPKFQNRQSVFFQMCPCLWCLKKTLININSNIIN